MKKSDYRAEYLSKRMALSEDEVRKKSEAIFLELAKTNVWEYSYYMSYYPLADKKEPSTLTLHSELLKLGKKVYLPKVEGDKMYAVEYTADSPMVENNWGILEPDSTYYTEIDKIELYFIPLLAYDFKGNRVGYGKGFYDAFLAQASPYSLKVGLSFFPPIEEVIPTEKTDVALDYCVTPDAVLSFSAKS